MYKKIKSLTVALLFFFPSTLALGQGNGNGNGGGGGSAESPTEAISQLQTDLDTLELEVASINEYLDELELQEITVVCTIGGNELQSAINSVPASGAIISVSGTCDNVDIVGKTNLIIDGGGATTISGDIGDELIAAVEVQTSTNIRISGVNVAANGDVVGMLLKSSTVVLWDSTINGSSGAGLRATLASFVALADVTINSLGAGNGLSLDIGSTAISDGNLTINALFNDAIVASSNSVYSQNSGTIDIEGSLVAQFSSTVAVGNGSVVGGQPPSGAENSSMLAHRNGSIVLVPFSDTSTLNINGRVELYSGGTIDNFSLDLGVINLSGTQVFTQRNASLFLNGTAGTVNLSFPDFRIRQNSVNDLLGVNFLEIPTTFELQSGSGVRYLDNSSAPTLLTVSCDNSTWGLVHAVCEIQIP